MKYKRARYRPETFKMVIVVAGFFAICLAIHNGGFSKTEGIVTIAFCSFISFFLGRISVPDDGEFPKDDQEK
jgi:hypothetical protein